MTLLADIGSAAIAGGGSTPRLASTPAAGDDQAAVVTSLRLLSTVPSAGPSISR
jgi:hypothetical protein